MKTYQFITFAVLLAAMVAIAAFGKNRKKCNCQHSDTATETDLGVVEDAG